MHQAAARPPALQVSVFLKLERNLSVELQRFVFAKPWTNFSSSIWSSKTSRSRKIWKRRKEVFIKTPEPSRGQGFCEEKHPVLDTTYRAPWCWECFLLSVRSSVSARSNCLDHTWPKLRNSWRDTALNLFKENDRADVLCVNFNIFDHYSSVIYEHVKNIWSWSTQRWGIIGAMYICINPLSPEHHRIYVYKPRRHRSAFGGASGSKRVR